MEEIGGEALEAHYRYFATLPGIKEVFEKRTEAGFPLPTFQINHLANFSHGNLLFITYEPCPEAHDIFIRFASIFEQTYTRFLDLQKAEAQTRESQIQLALERVRARTMAMQRSDELVDTAGLLFQQIKELGVDQWGNSFQLWDDDMKAITAWTCTQGVRLPIFKIPTTEDPVMINIVNAARKGEDLYVEPMGGEALQNHYNYMFSLPTLKEVFFGKLADAGFTPPTFQIFHAAYFSYGYILFITHEPYPEAHDIFKRFAKVFEQTYTRFLDLQKAEAQARESQIQLALERVRARTMAMHHSSELSEAAALLFDQLKQLGAELWSCGFAICEKNNVLVEKWMFATVGQLLDHMFIPHDADDAEQSMYDTWKNNIDLYAFVTEGDELRKIYENLMTIPTVKEVFQKIIESGIALPVWQKNHIASYKYGYLLIITTKPFEETQVFVRFAKVFEQTYTRFLDLQKAEAQAREAQIQLAMERVRARTMAMQRSEELQDVAVLLFQQVKELGIQAWSTGFNIWQEGDEAYIDWVTNPSGGFMEPYTVDLTTHPIFREISEAKKRGEDFRVFDFSGEALAETYALLVSFAPKQFEAIKVSGIPLPARYINHYVYSDQVGLMFITFEPVPEAHDIFKRFGKVFEQTYTRFLDLQKAEAQAREATIESALEKVRGRAMAMHKSDELLEAGELLYRELSKLGIPSLTAGYVLMDEEEKIGWNYTASPADGKIAPLPVGIPHTETSVMKSVAASWKKQEPYYFIELDAQETIAHQTYIAEHSINFPYTAAELISFSPGKIVLHSFNFKQGYLLIVGSAKLTADQEEMMLRFTKVFEMTYTRFLDLQKAEAQAREAKIEAALEKVRSRTMAMQHSNDLQDTAFLLFQQVQALDVTIFACGFNIWDDDRKAATAWMAREDGIAPPFKTSSAEDVFFHIHEAAQRGESLFVKEQGGEELETHYRYLNTIPLFKEEAEKIAQAGVSFPTFQIMHCAYFSQGYLMFISYESVPDAHDIFKRFAKVFEQTYTRFLDLQKAEAQAREAQIEAALERVRSRSMAMQNSDELAELVATVFKELNRLEFALTSCIIWINNPESLTAEMWVASTEMNKPPEPYYIKPFHHPYFKSVLNAWKEKNKKWVYEMKGEEKKIFQQTFFNEVGSFPSIIKKALEAPESVVYSASFYNFGALEIVATEKVTDKKFEILHRLGKVFDMSYTRFNDLKQAEAQAREAQIQLAMERVRARTMAMQRSDELAEAASILFKQVYDLGINSYSTGFNIWEADDISATAWMSKPDGEIQIPVRIPYTEDPFFKEIYAARQSGKDFLVMESGGEELAETYRYMFNLLGLKEMFNEYEDSGFPTPTFQITHCVFFSQGYLMFITLDAYPEAWDIFKRFGKVFEQTYTRFLDLQKAEAQAREAKIEAALERVRSRTMAMQKSVELHDAARLLFQQIQSLGVPPWSCGFNIWEPGDKIFTSYMGGSEGTILAAFKIPLTRRKRLFTSKSRGTGKRSDQGIT